MSNMDTSNFQKHTSKNPIQQFLINNFYNSLLKVVTPLYVKNVLDAGCGEGFSLNKLKENNIGEELEGIDYSKKAISFGKNLFPHLSLKIGSIYDLPYKDNTFDIVLGTEVLEHLENPKKALQEILRVSKKYILVSVPNEPFFMIGNFLRGKNVMQFGNDPEHIQHWTIFSFLKLVKEHGVRIKTVRFPFPWIMILGEK